MRQYAEIKGLSFGTLFVSNRALFRFIFSTKVSQIMVPCKNFMVLCRKTLGVIILSHQAVENLIFFYFLQNFKLFPLMPYLKQGDEIHRFYSHLKIGKFGLRVGILTNFYGSLQELFENSFSRKPLLCMLRSFNQRKLMFCCFKIIPFF